MQTMTGNMQMPTDRKVAAYELAEMASVEWVVTDGMVDYQAAVDVMERRVAEISSGTAPEMIWLLQHPPIYTAGTSARDEDLLQPDRFPIHRTGRGGQFTYHGPGQRVIYVMLDIKRRTGDVRAFVALLERWLIGALAELGVAGETRTDRVGVWTARPGRQHGHEDKIAAIGIRVRRWISYHGMSLNVCPELEHFSGIVPCGVTAHGVTSLQDLGVGRAAMADADTALEVAFRANVGPIDRKLKLEL